MNNKPTVTIGIPAYLAEKNIVSLVESALSQNSSNFILEKVIIYCDYSGDNTATVLAQHNFPKTVEIIKSTTRIGFAAGVKKLLALSNSQITILLNDDIKISGPNFIKSIVDQMQLKNAGLVCGNVMPIKPKTFVQKAATSTFYAWYESRYYHNHGHNKQTVDGKTLAFSLDFKKVILNKLNQITDLHEIGNVDSYLYYECLLSGFNYYHSKDAVAYFSYPSTTSEYIKWTIRNKQNSLLMKARYPTLTKIHTKLHKRFYLNFIKQFLLNPLGATYVFLIHKYCAIKATSNYQNFTSSWETLKSTKEPL